VAARKSIFVTGAASGIGRAVATLFAERGWFVGLADIDQAGLVVTASGIPEGQSASYALDVRDRVQWDAVLRQFWTDAGQRMDVLFNNAGVGRGGAIASAPKEDTDLVIDVNFKGVVYGAEAGFAYLRNTPGSCLLNTASAAGIFGAPGMSIYCATKFAVRGLTESLDQEWDEHGIRVASLMPAFIDTPILDHIGIESNRPTREIVAERGMEISPVSLVAEAAWKAAHGDEVHVRVGKSSHRLWFLSRYAPGFLRNQMKKGGRKARNG
jgi:NAD(P)-dependent dehydrogenase (short-subunit alcohol dehydrogenase family)